LRPTGSRSGGFQRQAWGTAYTQLSAAAAEGPLELADLENLAIAAYLNGRDAESEEAWTKAHHEFLRAADWRAGGPLCLLAGHHPAKLLTIARQGHGRVLMRLGRVAKGTALLDGRWWQSPLASYRR